jgi:hypothetical protein
MTPKDPQFLYMILVLPSLFGLTLMGEGIYKCIHEEWSGLISVFFGMLFIGMVVFAYLFFSSYMLGKGM